ncbi:MAG: T9SS C-terminal target domain-containing protein [Bacteroidetes bacterium]|nr:MAG: T9SS C-terminal target domain-containing protein [Bacteroidota bacterium]
MDAFVVQYDTSGTVLWAKRGGGGSNDEGYSISGDAAGNLYVAGYFNQTATFGSVSLTTSGISDAFIAKYNDSGDVLWAAKAGGNSDDRARSVATDAQGNSYLAGYYTSASAAFGTVSLAGGAGDHSFVAKYAPDGTLVWAKALHGDSKAQAVAVYGENIYVCGGFSGDTLQVGPSLLLIEGNQDLYVARFDLSGTATWGLKQNSGGESNEFATCLDTDGTGNLYTAGYFDSDPIAFGPSTLSNTRNGFDLFVARLGTGSTAVEEVDETGFAIYPNPGAGAFTVESPVAISSIGVFSVRGEKIYSQDYPLNALQQAIYIASLPPGVYVVKVQAGERGYVRRWVKN